MENEMLSPVFTSIFAQSIERTRQQIIQCTICKYHNIVNLELVTNEKSHSTWEFIKCEWCHTPLEIEYDSEDGEVFHKGVDKDEEPTDYSVCAKERSNVELLQIYNNNQFQCYSPTYFKVQLDELVSRLQSCGFLKEEDKI